MSAQTIPGSLLTQVMTPAQQEHTRETLQRYWSQRQTNVIAVSIGLGILWFLLAGSAGSPGFIGLTLIVLVGVVLALFGRLYWSRAHMYDEVQAGTVERASGQVEWRSGHYHAHVPGRGELNLFGLSLAAGNYDFNYLPRSRWLVSADLNAADSPTRDADVFQHVLATTNHFNLDDLPHFRQGRLGPEAARRMRRDWSIGVWLIVATVVLLILFLVGALGGGNALLETVGCLGTVLFGIAGLSTIVSLSGRSQDVLAGKVLAAEGALGKTSRVVGSGRSRHTEYYYALDDQRWLVRSDAYNALIEGRTYRVYYLPRSKALVGIEPVAPPAATGA